MPIDQDWFTLQTKLYRYLVSAHQMNLNGIQNLNTLFILIERNILAIIEIQNPISIDNIYMKANEIILIEI